MAKRLSGVRNNSLNKAPGNTGTTNPIVKSHGMPGSKSTPTKVRKPRS